jgi:hypothetical protein
MQLRSAPLTLNHAGLIKGSVPRGEKLIRLGAFQAVRRVRVRPNTNESAN